VMPQSVGEVIRMDDGTSLPGFIRGLASGFRALITHSPAFIAGQVPLDAMTYMARETGRQGGARPDVVARVGYELVRSYGEAFRGLFDGTFHGDAAAYLKAGGGMAGMQGRSMEATKGALEDLSHRSMLEIRNKGDIGRLLKWIGTAQPFAAVGQRVELAPRVASFNLAKRRTTPQQVTDQIMAPDGTPIGEVSRTTQRPLSEVERTMAGRDVSLDFERGGTFARVLNQGIPFFNVGFQSAATLPRALRENPVGFSTALLGLVGAPTIAAEAWNRSDPQLAKDYADVPDYVKDRNIVLMLPGKVATDEQGNRRPNYLTIPVRDLAPVVILAREAAARIAGDDPRAWDELLGATATAASPVQANSPADLFGMGLPPGISTALQLSSDHDWFRDQRIATKSRDEDASALSKGVAPLASRVLDRDVRPSQVEFATRDVGGGLARAAHGASDLLTGRERDPSRPQNTPVVGDLIRRWMGDQTGGTWEEAREELLTPATRRALREAGVGYTPSQVEAKIGKVPLLRAEVGELQALTNRYTEERLQAAMADPRWQSVTPVKRDEVVRTVVVAARERARREMAAKIGPAEGRRRALVSPEQREVGR
jgi:hypothetical protein